METIPYHVTSLHRHLLRHDHRKPTEHLPRDEEQTSSQEIAGWKSTPSLRTRTLGMACAHTISMKVNIFGINSPTCSSFPQLQFDPHVRPPKHGKWNPPQTREDYDWFITIDFLGLVRVSASNSHAVCTMCIYWVNILLDPIECRWLRDQIGLLEGQSGGKSESQAISFSPGGTLR